tara:strand:- start:588 stop:1478 length:891 start_codon:yes stop_codon:yes gene_type:complete
MPTLQEYERLKDAVIAEVNRVWGPDGRGYLVLPENETGVPDGASQTIDFIIFDNEYDAEYDIQVYFNIYDSQRELLDEMIIGRVSLTEIDEERINIQVSAPQGEAGNFVQARFLFETLNSMEEVTQEAVASVSRFNIPEGWEEYVRELGYSDDEYDDDYEPFLTVHEEELMAQRNREIGHEEESPYEEHEAGTWPAFKKDGKSQMFVRRVHQVLESVQDPHIIKMLPAEEKQAVIAKLQKTIEKLSEAAASEEKTKPEYDKPEGIAGRGREILKPGQSGLEIDESIIKTFKRFLKG